MKKFTQLHILTNYAASNLNRDDLGRPKTLIFGNRTRLRTSSQSNKRAFRVSDVFQEYLGSNIGIRTKSIGYYAFLALTRGLTFEEILKIDEKEGSLEKIERKKAIKLCTEIAKVFGANKKGKPDKNKDDEDKGKHDEYKRKQEEAPLHTEQLVHISPEEIAAVSTLVEKIRASKKEPEKEDLELLRKDNSAADIAMFGRMLADHKNYNVDASVQVSHSFSVHSCEIEDDYFTAVDDLNRDDSGAGHLGVFEFGAGLFYTYICIDNELLLENLGGNKELANKSIQALCKAVCTIAPGGKQNSFASRAYASYCLAEKGNEQPRSLSVSFLKPLDKTSDLINDAVEKLEETKKNMDETYELDMDCKSFNAHSGQGKLSDILNFVVE